MKKTNMTPKEEVSSLIVEQLVALSIKTDEADPNAPVYAPEYNRQGNGQRSGRGTIWENEW